MVNKKKPAAPAAETRAVNALGKEYKAEQRTGNRAQKGNLRGGAPCWVYEVKWSGGFKNTTTSRHRASSGGRRRCTDELAAYLAPPQITYQTEWDALEWWEKNAKKFPNLSVVARQYLGCPAISATVERLFSQVGIAFSDKRKSSSSDTLSDIIFT